MIYYYFDKASLNTTVDLSKRKMTKRSLDFIWRGFFLEMNYWKKGGNDATTDES